jgi:hypothetical protein
MKGVNMKRTTFLLLFIISITSLFAQQQGGERFVQIINRLVEAMNAQNYEAIVHEYDKGMSTAIPLEKTTIFFKNLESQYGKVNKLDPPQVRTIDQAVCTMYFERGTQDLTLYLDEQGKIKGFIFTTHIIPEPQPTQQSTPTTTQTTNPPPAAEQKPTSNAPVTATSTSTPSPAPVQMQPIAPVVTDKQQTELYLPFKGAWAVITGGEFREGAAQRNLLLQQYAYEFSEMDANGLRYKTDGKVNEDYIGYGKEVLSPADGIAVEVIDGIRDNPPGIRNPYAPIGNAIIIQHSGREYSVLAFLKQGSTRIKVGDRVTRGQVIAQCGSSGNATEPVIHYHLQDSSNLQTARGTKFYFERAMTNKEGKKELKLIHLPEIGEVISSE